MAAWVRELRASVQLLVRPRIPELNDVPPSAGASLRQ